ncbi:uncharacterized protein LY89DRAFT_80036 [Mollisia scopiformis]|uniref:Uncharacterized protein n=1 Tax=Mollisia scopiformis TaxID=149040 RepID=A0A194X833_MOLSC|nr:uncharacterized protein LY89DRAFT_80036 [Mollisia scopiformis]KUJ16325.1 hypothetical protein LY89DRAFT_80036 [Mollisia scopiformis]
MLVCRYLPRYSSSAAGYMGTVPACVRATGAMKGGRAFGFKSRVGLRRIFSVFCFVSIYFPRYRGIEKFRTSKQKIRFLWREGGFRPWRPPPAITSSCSVPRN